MIWSVSMRGWHGETMKPRTRCQRILFILVSMTIVPVGVLSTSYSSRGTEITRYRNALLAEAGTEKDFLWTPHGVPKGFLSETIYIPEQLRHRSELFGDGDVLTKIRMIVKSLSRMPHKGNAIAKPTLITLKIIEEEGTGYCADFSKVFNALAYSAGIPVRQWAFSFDGFGGWGHTFNEVWDDARQRWIMIDVFNSFIPYDTFSAKPLSALVFRQMLIHSPEHIRFDKIEPGHFGFSDELSALSYFQRGVNEWYLWFGNNALSYDNNFIVAFAVLFGRLPEQAAGVVTGVHPRMKVMVLPENEKTFQRLIRLKYSLFAAGIVEIGLGVMLMWQMIQLRK